MNRPLNLSQSLPNPFVPRLKTAAQAAAPAVLKADSRISLSDSLQQSQEILIAVIRTDARGVMQYASPELVELTRLEPDQVEGYHLSHLWSASLPRTITDGLYLKMSQGQSFTGFLLLNTPDHQWTFVNATPEYLNNQLNGYCLICRRVPLRAQQQLQPLYQQLLQLEAEPHEGSLASQLHMQRWASRMGHDLCQVMRRLFKEHGHANQLS